MDYHIPNFSAYDDLTLLGEPVSHDMLCRSGGYGAAQPKVLFVWDDYRFLGSGDDGRVAGDMGNMDHPQVGGRVWSHAVWSLFREGLVLGGIADESYHSPIARLGYLTEEEQYMYLKCELQLFRPQRVVAVGRVAERYLLKVKDLTATLSWFDSLPHPAFWLRFYQNAMTEYPPQVANIGRMIHPSSIP